MPFLNQKTNMADISKCEGGNCPAKNHCYRYTVKADSLRQSYFTEPPLSGFGVSTKGTTTVYCVFYEEDFKNKLPDNIKIASNNEE